MGDTTCPRVLVVAMGRVNESDTANNGLLLRNLFGAWPRDRTGQVFSSGDNGDPGFFGRYYRLGTEDRRFGSLFYRLKAGATAAAAPGPDAQVAGPNAGASGGWRALATQLLVGTGLYEILFRPRLSADMRAWLDSFRPDIVFAQGYSLAFTWIPLLVGEHCRVPIAYFPTDDWAGTRYNHSFPNLASRWISKAARRQVVSASCRLVECARVRIAFNRYMKDEYRERYGEEFAVLMHGDDPGRFASAIGRRAAGARLIVCAGDFDQYRWPLVHDLDEACEMLNRSGLEVRATVFQVGPIAAVPRSAGRLRHVRVESSPSHADLPAALKAADVLYLPERFDDTARFIRLSVSSKAHLFMFSGRPILVYSHPATGITRYASDEGWAAVVDRRDVGLLAETLRSLLVDEPRRRQLVATAAQVAMRNHYLPDIERAFRGMLRSAADPARDRSPRAGK